MLNNPQALWDLKRKKKIKQIYGFQLLLDIEIPFGILIFVEFWEGDRYAGKDKMPRNTNFFQKSYVAK